MTVSELRKALQGLPDDMPVFLCHPDSGWPISVKTVEAALASDLKDQRLRVGVETERYLQIADD